MANKLDNIRLFSDTHAIEVANFGVNLGLAIDNADVRRFDESMAKLRELFPAIDSPEVFQFAVGNAPPGQFRAPPPVPVRKLVYFANDGQPVWEGFFGENRILVSCRRYTGWEEVWPEAKVRMDALLGCIDQYKPIQSVDYSVTDTFSATKAEEALIAPNIFKPNNFVSAQILGTGDPRWDFSQGWFDNLQDNDQVLVRVESRSGIQNDLVVTSISNLHSQRFGAVNGVGELLQTGQNGSRADQIFDDFHDRNKDLLRSLLVDELLIRMRLKEEA